MCIKLKAIQLIASVCWITILKPYLLFIIALKHIIHTCISSFVSPIFNFAAWRDLRLTPGLSNVSILGLRVCELILELFDCNILQTPPILGDSSENN